MKIKQVRMQNSIKKICREEVDCGLDVNSQSLLIIQDHLKIAKVNKEILDLYFFSSNKIKLCGGNIILLKIRFQPNDLVLLVFLQLANISQERLYDIPFLY